VKEMFKKPDDIKHQYGNEKKQHESQPEIAYPGEGFRKMTGMCPFQYPCKNESRDKHPERGNKPDPDHRARRESLKGTDKNIIIYKGVNCDYNGHKYDDSICSQGIFNFGMILSL